MLTIQVRRQDGGDEETREFEVECVTIGRHPDNDLVLPESTVSRKHAQIVLKHGAYYIVDLGSAHGIYIDKQRVQDDPLPPRCEIYLNPFVLRVTADPPAADAADDETVKPGVGGPEVAPSGDAEALQTLPAAGGAPIELDIEDATGDRDLPMLGEDDDEGGIIPLADGSGAAASAVMEVGDGGVVAAEPEPDPEPAPEPEPAYTPDAAPDNIVGTIFELNMGPPTRATKAAAPEAESRPTADLSKPPKPPTSEFATEIEVDADAKSGGGPRSEMVMAPTTAAFPAGTPPQGIDEGTVLEYSAQDVHEYADQVDAERARAGEGDDGDAALSTLPQHGHLKSDGAVPRTRAFVGGPAAGPASKVTPELQSRIPDLLAGREHGRLLALLGGLSLAALTLIPTRGAPVPAFMGGAGIASVAWLTALFGGVGAIIGARLIPSALWRGVLVALAGLTPLLVLLVTFDASEVMLWLDAGKIAETATPLKSRAGAALVLGWFVHNPIGVWLLVAGSVLLAAAGRIARTWPESGFPRVLGPIAGLLCLATGLIAAGGTGLPYAVLFDGTLDPAGWALLAVPVAGVFGVALAAGKGRVITYLPVALLAIGLCATGVLHLRPRPVYIDQARLALLPVPMIFLAATGLAASAIAVLTRRRPDAQELLDRL